MEYSLAQSLEGHSELYNTPFPHLSSQPALDQVTPGLGQIVNSYETIVPMRGRAQHVIEKNVDLPTTSTEAKDGVPIQIGSGQSKLDPEILESFKHPIITDSIIFPKQATAKKHKIEQSGENNFKKARKTVNHKFQIV